MCGDLIFSFFFFFPREDIPPLFFLFSSPWESLRIKKLAYHLFPPSPLSGWGTPFPGQEIRASPFTKKTESTSAAVLPLSEGLRKREIFFGRSLPLSAYKPSFLRLASAFLILIFFYFLVYDSGPFHLPLAHYQRLSSSFCTYFLRGYTTTSFFPPVALFTEILAFFRLAGRIEFVAPLPPPRPFIAL